jgi:uncharacterized membrane protein
MESTDIVDVGTLNGALNTEILAINETGSIIVGQGGDGRQLVGPHLG